MNNDIIAFIGVSIFFVIWIILLVDFIVEKKKEKGGKDNDKDGK